jgi:hypothetical protein
LNGRTPSPVADAPRNAACCYGDDDGPRLGLPHRSRAPDVRAPSHAPDRTASSSPSRSARVAREHYVHAYSSSYVPLVYWTSSIVPLGTNLPFDAASVR